MTQPTPPNDIDIVTQLRDMACCWRGNDPIAIELRQAADEIERLRAERDEVRESYCLLMEAYRGGDGRVTANKLGWCYLFAEDSK